LRIDPLIIYTRHPEQRLTIYNNMHRSRVTLYALLLPSKKSGTRHHAPIALEHTREIPLRIHTLSVSIHRLLGPERVQPPSRLINRPLAKPIVHNDRNSLPWRDVEPIPETALHLPYIKLIYNICNIRPQCKSLHTPHLPSL
jgi:hypothetical protein